jgi:hypothetical protein
MLWFSHRNDLRRNPAVLRVEQRLGEAGYARWSKLLEVVSQFGGNGPGFEPRLDLRGPATDEGWLANELGISTCNLRKTLRVFSEVGLIDSEEYGNKVIAVPMLADLRDEFTKKKQRDRQKIPGKNTSQAGLNPPEVANDTDSVRIESGIPNHTRPNRTVNENNHTKPNGVAGRSFSASFHQETGKTLSISEAERETTTALRKEHGEDFVWRCWMLFLKRTAGFEGLFHPLSKFVEEFEQHASIVKQRAEIRLVNESQI